MGHSTISNLRVGKKSKLAGVPKLTYITPAFDATVATTAEYVLPDSAVITGVGSLVGTLDAAGDTVDVGTTSGGAELVNELVAGASQAVVNIVGIPLVDGKVYVGVGATSTGTAGGTAQLVIEYYLADSTFGANK